MSRPATRGSTWWRTASAASTLGTPWEGTRLAVFFRGPHALECLYGAHHLDGLAPPAVQTFSIWGEDDPFVVPATSALPEGVEGVRLQAAGNMDLLVSARAFRAVEAALEHPGIESAEPAAPEPEPVPAAAPATS